jgi:hypothetical protein
MKYYFDIELSYDDETRVYTTLSPEYYKIITIQYQPLDEGGCPLSDLRILKEWESSEEEMVREFAKVISPKKTWSFVPIGYNVIFDLGFFRARAKKYGMEYSEWLIYHRLPLIDLKHICVGMNGFRFADSGLDRFCGKPMDGSMVPEWYLNREYEKILEYIRRENKAFISFYRRLIDTLPKFRAENGFYGY